MKLHILIFQHFLLWHALEKYCTITKYNIGGLSFNKNGTVEHKMMFWSSLPTIIKTFVHWSKYTYDILQGKFIDKKTA